MSKANQDRLQAILKSADPPDQSVGTSNLEMIKATLPGLSLGKILSDLGTEMKHQAVMGRNELSSALFHGHDGFIKYDRTGQEEEKQQPLHGLPNEITQPEQDLGREM